MTLACSDSIVFVGENSGMMMSCRSIVLLEVNVPAIVLPMIGSLWVNGLMSFGMHASLTHDNVEPESNRQRYGQCLIGVFCILLKRVYVYGTWSGIEFRPFFAFGEVFGVLVN